MNKEMDSALIAKRIGENIPSVKKHFDEQRIITEEEKRKSGPKFILKEKMDNAGRLLTELQKRIFDESKVVEIFNQLRDQKVLMLSTEPVYKEEEVKKKFIEKLLTGKNRDIIRTKISDYLPAEVCVSEELRAYFYFENKLVSWNKTQEQDNNPRMFLRCNEVSLKFNENKYGVSVVTAKVEDCLLKIKGKETYIVDEKIDLSTAIEYAIANPYRDSFGYTNYGLDSEDIWDKEPPYTNVKLI